MAGAKELASARMIRSFGVADDHNDTLALLTCDWLGRVRVETRKRLNGASWGCIAPQCAFEVIGAKCWRLVSSHGAVQF